MGVTAQTAEETFIGAGDVFVDDAPVGATTESNVFRVTRTYYTPKLNGVPGPLKGLDYIQEETAELEVTITELDSEHLAYAIPGSLFTAGDAEGVATAGGEATTLAANSAVGAVNVKVADVAALAIGDAVQIGAAGSREFRVLTAVGTAGAGGTGITFLGPLTLAHTTGDAVVEVDATTLAADAAAGATNLKLTSVTGLAVGDFLRFGYPGEQEVRQLTAVGTAGAGGSGVTFDVPTNLIHRSGDPALEQTGSGAGVIESNTGVQRRLPSSAYHKWELRVPGLDGREIRFTLFNAIMTDNAEFEAKDDGMPAPRLTLQARWDPADGTASPWQIQRLAATA